MRNSLVISFGSSSVKDKMQKKSKMTTEPSVEGVQASGQEQRETEFVACSLIAPGSPLRAPDYEDKQRREPQGFYENPFNKSLDWLKNQHHDQPIQPEEDHIERIPEWSTTQNPPSTVAKSTMAIATQNQVPTWTTMVATTCTATLPATSTTSLGIRTVTSAAVIPNSTWQYPSVSTNITVTEQQQQFLHQQILQQQIFWQQYRPQIPELNPIPNWYQQSQRRNQCRIRKSNQQQSESQQQFQLQFQTRNQYHQQTQRQPITYLPYATQSYQIQSQVQPHNLSQLPYLQPHIQVQPQYIVQQQQPLQLSNIPSQHPVVIPPQLNLAALNQELAQQILHQHQTFMSAHLIQSKNQEQQQPQRQQKDKHKKQKFDN